VWITQLTGGTLAGMSQKHLFNDSMALSLIGIGSMLGGLCIPKEYRRRRQHMKLERKRNTMNRMALLSVVIVFALGATSVALAQQHQHEHEDFGPAKFEPPTNYRQAVEEIEHRLHLIEGLMASKKLAEVHPQADVIQKVAKMIGQLALKDDSGVPKEAVKEVNIAGKDLATKFEPIDKAADSGDAAGTQKVYDEMVKLTETLSKYIPKVYSCPMKCEGETTYPQASDCPKCGMHLTRLKEHMDHEPKHGGVFFMAPDKFHHLEGTLSASSEFRIYFYDNFTKPMPAEKFTIQAGARPEGADKQAEKPLVMALEPGKAFLTGRIDPSLKLPITVKAFVDFKDGEPPQVFDFGFEAPSKEPAQAEGHGRNGH